ncbi:MAG: DUF2806 domain-containing protein [Lachnospiraceae bacterium]|jgi:hypothetical protein|nr:DUF2806 domain-containing protein [Lachnospiraceae bacterium]
MSVAEIVQALVSPAEKLIDAVSGAIGKAYEPSHIRKMADSKAYELQQISDAVRNNSDVPIVYNSTGVSIDTSNFEEITKRASSRLAYQEITKQQNIEAVADNAYQELENVAEVSSEPVNRDWMFRFFNSVENVSDKELQKIWGRILAGEIKSPNTYSYRTLEKLKNMTQQEVECFRLVAPFALYQNKNRFIINAHFSRDKYGIKFDSIMKLEECGLMLSRSLYYYIDFGEEVEPTSIFNNKIYGMIEPTNSNTPRIELPAYAFTESGKQLLDAICLEANEPYTLDCLEYICKNSKNVKVTAHRIKSISKCGIDYDNIDILKNR